MARYQSEKRAFQVFERLDTLSPEAVGAVQDDYNPEEIPYLRFHPEAQQVFNDWRAGLEQIIR